MAITFTIDLEDPSGLYEANGRYVERTQYLLNLCEQLSCRATFFTVGRVAQAAPNLMKEIAAKGHEVAYHSHNHVALTHEAPDRFRRESKDDKDRIEQLIGKTVIGYRAPQFSLTPSTLWATDILQELGFRYSSSLMPTSISRFGFADAPKTPFRWPNSLIELPLPVASFGSAHIPYLGGIYLYALPFFMSRYWINQAASDEVLWTYTHPYDFDRAEKFAPMPNTPLWVSLILRAARSVAEKKIRKVLSLGAAPPLAERVMSLTTLCTYS